VRAVPRTRPAADGARRLEADLPVADGPVVPGAAVSYPRGRAVIDSRRPHRLFAWVALAVLVALEELLFRGMFPVPEVVGFNRIHYQLLLGAHPNLRASLRRGLVYDKLLLESEPDGFREVHSLNLYGFRGRDFSIDPTSGRRRVLLIGDSVTEG